MNILFLAPQPFYQERGTPIAVNLFVQSLSARGDTVDLLTYHEGKDVSYPNVRHLRIRAVPGVNNVKPGFSVKKLICSTIMLFQAVRLAGARRYDLVHAVEDSVFIARLIKFLYGIPYVFDMDSCMSRQLVEAHPLLRPCRWVMRAIEAVAVRKASAVVAVCQSLAGEAEALGARKVFMIPDASLVAPGLVHGQQLDLRARFDLKGTCFMYIGNFEKYQGLDLLLESFARLDPKDGEASLLLIGGTPEKVREYEAKARSLGLGDRARFAGPVDVGLLAEAMSCADVLVSPRTKGSNTPMKIYSYMASGKPILATGIESHTQVLTPEVACLSPAEPRQFAEGMRTLMRSPALRGALSGAAVTLVRQAYSREAFHERVMLLYAFLEGPEGGIR